MCWRSPRGGQLFLSYTVYRSCSGGYCLSHQQQCSYRRCEGGTEDVKEQTERCGELSGRGSSDQAVADKDHEREMKKVHGECQRELFLDTFSAVPLCVWDIWQSSFTGVCALMEGVCLWGCPGVCTWGVGLVHVPGSWLQDRSIFLHNVHLKTTQHNTSLTLNIGKSIRGSPSQTTSFR